jgi:hypothetical protein
MAALRQAVRVGPALALVATVGLLLGACAGDGGGGALTTGTLTRTLPTLTRATETVTTAETTTVATTNEVTSTETATVPQPVPLAPLPAEEEPDNSAWAWLAIAVAFLVALVAGFLLWHRSRARAGSWSTELADLARRSLVTLDDVAREGSVVTGHVQALAAEAQALAGRAPDDRARAAAADLWAALDALAETLLADRQLRFSSPPPSAEQLSYSDALIREQVRQVQTLLRPS